MTGRTVFSVAGNYEKSLELSPSAVNEYTRGVLGNRNYRGISAKIVDNAISDTVDYSGLRLQMCISTYTPTYHIRESNTIMLDLHCVVHSREHVCTIVCSTITMQFHNSRTENNVKAQALHFACLLTVVSCHAFVTHVLTHHRRNAC